MNDRVPSSSDAPLSNDELLGWIELACWTMLVLWPLLYWANGPAVSTDQLVMRTALLCASALAALALRIRRWCRKRGQTILDRSERPFAKMGEDSCSEFPVGRTSRAE
ncbi:MAG: hypothetical protein KJ000_23105 [Pirellulaceae bacterium]|nr:hypothetical protein [Pirellulaceae bacterium]